MPVLSLQELTDDRAIHAIAARLARLGPGLVVATGQVRSGKVTTLVALAQLIAKGEGPIALMSDVPADIEVFAPLPPGWREVRVGPTAEAWTAALRSGDVADARVVVVSRLGPLNALAVAGIAAGRWVLVAADTPLIGLDVAYALQEMGIDHETFLAKVRGVWSQFLIAKLCADCAKPASLSPVEREELFPAESFAGELKVEAGCPACGGTGTISRQAVCEVLLLDDANRDAVKAALLSGDAPRLPPEWHMTAHDHARRLVAQGVVGVGTYGSAIRRNPLLRARNSITRERARSEKLDSASRHKSEFLANMSHELRTPLNAIIGFSEVLLNDMAGPVTPVQREFVGDIHASGKHLLALINDILDMSKIEAGKMELDVASFDLPETIGNAMTLVRARAELHGIRLDMHVDPEVGACEGDERKVKQVLLNLLTNAVKFTPDGGTVTVTARRAGDAYELAVSDTGIGIAEGDHEAVFEEFRQVGAKHAGKIEGTGLGLSLVRRLVELHGGRIRVASVLGQGATFTFTLPLR
jgi:signal transduction histidine kinase